MSNKINSIKYNKSAICGLLEPVLSRALRFRRACAVKSQKALGLSSTTAFTTSSGNSGNSRPFVMEI